MVLRKILGVFAITLLVGAASFATAGVPDLDLTTASMAYTGAESAVLLNIPNGGGSAFNAARIATGTVDATVTLTLLDGLGAPIANFPAEDMWLESNDGGMYMCTGGTSADFNTNASGVTQWVTPLLAGGSSEAGASVMISGAALNSGTLALNFNSPDISGDGVVNLSDVPLFVGDLSATVGFRSDFFFDGAVNLSDVAFMVQGLGAVCP